MVGEPNNFFRLTFCLKLSKQLNLLDGFKVIHQITIQTPVFPHGLSKILYEISRKFSLNALEEKF
jgi:hypothetical protein